ncbi:MAG TPA: type II secretion system protein GspJ [Gammaproteobacteria bacterium]|nr:type II secretion system protein GspJ [Gammaproteobacteria bacterium]
MSRQYSGLRQDGHGLRHGQAAFTLLELLVSLALFAVLSVIAYSTLQNIMEARQRSEAQAERLVTLQTLFTIMERDFEQAIQRGIRDIFGDHQAALLGTGEAVEFSRTGRRNPAGFARSNLLRVAYLLEDDELKRRTWRVMDRAQDSQYQEAVLAQDIETIEIRYLDGQLNWKKQWPIPNPASSAPPALPRAIEFSIENEELGRITRLFRIPQGMAAAPKGAT